MPSFAAQIFLSACETLHTFECIVSPGFRRAADRRSTPKNLRVASQKLYGWLAAVFIMAATTSALAPEDDPFAQDADLEPGEIFDPDKHRKLDAFVLGERRQIGASVLNRSGVGPVETPIDEEVANLNVNVAAYDANRLEHRLIQQVCFFFFATCKGFAYGAHALQAESALDEARAKASTLNAKATAPNRDVQRVLNTADAVKQGDNTPFEIMIQKQLDHELGATERRQAKRIEELRKTRQLPSRVKALKTRRYDSDDFFSREDTEDGDQTDYDAWITDDEGEVKKKKPQKAKQREASKSKKKQKKSGRSAAIQDDGDEKAFIERLRFAIFVTRAQDWQTCVF